MDWRTVPIKENGEPLLELVETAQILIDPIYRQRGYSQALKKVYLRAGVIIALKEATASLPRGLQLLVWDGWRPLALQEQLHQHYYKQIELSSGLTGEALEELVLKFVSLPSSDPLKPSPHYTGGAVDLTLWDQKTRSELPMGAEFDQMGAAAADDYYQEREPLIHQNRRILRDAMIAAGFSSYPHEFWHFDKGNQFWGAQTQRAAYYGPIELSTRG